MKTQTRAGAMLLVGVLAGSSYGMTLTLHQGAQDNSNQQQGQQNKDNKKKKSDQPATNTGTAQPNNPPPSSNPPPNNPPPSNSNSGDKPTPLFGGTIGIKSSRQTKDSATLGFNGVDPNGQVQKAMLSAAATPTDAMKAQQMTQLSITPADLAQFLQDGGLNPEAAPQKP
jgi:hypothetical protein